MKLVFFGLVGEKKQYFSDNLKAKINIYFSISLGIKEHNIGFDLVFFFNSKVKI